MRLRTITTVMAALVVFAAGCDMIAEQAAEEVAEQAAGGEVNLDVDESGGNISVETSEGTMSFGGGGDLPDSFPEDLPLPEGDYEVASSFEQSGGDAGDLRLQTAVMTTAAYDDVVAHFESALADAGWEVQDTQSMSMGEDLQSTTFVTVKGDQGANISITRAEQDQVLVNYGVGSADNL